MKASVLSGVRAGEADDVVAANRRRSLHDPERQIVVVEQRFAAGVLGQAVERVLRPLEVAHHVLRGLPGQQPETGRRRLRGVPERRHRHEPARVDRKDRHVRANGRVDRRAQLRLVVHAVQPQAARKVDERFFLGQIPQHRRRCLQCRQLAIRVQDVELRIVLPECRADIRRLIRHVAGVPPLAVDQRLDDLLQRRAVAGEVLLHAHRATLERHHGDEILRGDLLADELAGRGVSARLVGRRHRRQIEVENEQPAIPVSNLAGGRRGDLRLYRGCDGRLASRWRRGQRRQGRGVRGVHALKCDLADRLRHAVFGDREVARREPFDRTSFLVRDGDVDDGQPRGAAKRRLLCVGGDRNHQQQDQWQTKT